MILPWLSKRRIMLLQKKGLRTIDHALAATPPRQNRPQAALQKSGGHSRRRLLFGLVWACVSGYNGAAFLFDQLMREFRQAPFGRTTPDASMIRSSSHSVSACFVFRVTPSTRLIRFSCIAG